MPEPPRTPSAVVDLVRKSELADDDVLASFLQNAEPLPPSAADTASAMVRAGILTEFQARAILQGKHRGFRLGHYKILDQIGVGGMGQVYLAEHVRMKRLVALKVLPGRHALSAANVERFYREARAAAALDHPNIVRAHDVACDKGTHFLVLEYIEGEPLTRKLASAGGRLPVAEACAYAIQAAAGLQHAHERKLVHRDVKPGNLLVDRDGVLKILDMGLARFFESDEDRLTHRLDPGGVMGTADYVCPEQLVDCARADHRGDIYSLGATLYHLVTGRPPFDGTTTAKLVAHQLHSVPAAHTVRPDVPEALSAVIARMMAKNPDDRYQSAAEVVAALLPFVEEGAAAGGPRSSGRLPAFTLAAISQSTANLTVPAGVRRPARGRRLWVTAGVAALLVVAGVIAALWKTDRGPTTPGAPAAPADALARLYSLDVGRASVESALFTPDDQFLVTAGTDQLVRVWDANTGAAVRELEGHANSVRALAFLPGGKRVLSASHDKTLKLWDVATGECLRTYEGHAAGVVGVAALPDGRRFASSAVDGAIRLWDAETGEVLREYPRAPLPVYALAVTPDGLRAVAGTWDSRRNAAKQPDPAKLPPVEVWTFEVETGKELSRRKTDSSVSHVRVSPDGRTAAFGTARGVALWDLDANRIRTLGGAERRVTCAAFTPDGRRVLGTGYDKSLHVWELAGEKPVVSKEVLPGQGYFVGLSHDGTRVAVTGADGGAAVWRLPAAVAGN